MKRLGLVLVLAAVACGGSEEASERDDEQGDRDRDRDRGGDSDEGGGSSSGMSGNMPELRESERRAILEGARAGTIQGEWIDAQGINLAGELVVSTLQPDDSGDDGWTVPVSIDGQDTDVLVIYDDEADRVYLAWDRADHDCRSAALLNLLVLKTDLSFTAAVLGSCDQADLILGCSFDAGGSCEACGICAMRGNVFACAADERC
jgi:hypothetical protein